MKARVLLRLAVVAVLASCVIAPQRPAVPTVAPAGQRGVVLPTWEKRGYSDTDTQAAMRDIASVGANWVQIVPTWYQLTLTSNDIAPTESSVDDANVRQAVRLARSAGLKVMLKPHVDPMHGGNRAHIDPSNPDAWFLSYRHFITHYAELARQLDVDQFAVGTELVRVSQDRQRWLPVVKDVRERYGGPLVYAAQHMEYSAVSFWDAVDFVGIDAYWELSEEPTTDVAQLRDAFAAKRDELAAFSARVGRPILFTEAGYPSQVGAATAPWDENVTEQPAQEEQAAAYQALLATFSDQPWWAGVFWWTWRVQHRYSVYPSEELDHSVRGKLAESVLGKWWGKVPASKPGGSVRQ